MIPVLAREHRIDAREFSETSHVQSLLYGHAAHALSLNDICDALAVHEAEFMRVRGATPPARNTFVSRKSSTRSSSTTQPSRKIPCKCGRNSWYYIARVPPMGCQ